MKGKNRFFKLPKLDMQKKYLLIYVVVLAIPTILFGLYMFKEARESVVENALEKSMGDMQLTKTDVEKSIDIFDVIGQSVLVNGEFIGFISSEEKYDILEVFEFKLGAMNDINKILGVNNVRFFVNNSTIPTIDPLIININEKGLDDWANSIEYNSGGTYWEFNHDYDYFLSIVANENLVTMFKQLKDVNGRQYGILQIAMKPENFFSGMQIEAGYEDKSYIVLANDGELIFNRDIMPDALKKDFKQYCYELFGSNDEGSELKTIDGVDYIVTYTTIVSGVNLKIVSIQPLANISNDIREVRNRIILYSLLIFFALIAVTYYVNYTIYGRIKNIVSSMRRVQEGDLDVSIPVTGNDEVSELAYHYNKMLRRIKLLIKTVIQKQVATKDAEIRALHSQINKHFIYNVLEAINMMAIVSEEYKISDTVTSLGSLMRYSLSWDNELSTVEQEIKNVGNYINLINVRYHQKVNLHIDADENIQKNKIIKMSLQPIVENAFNHGIEGTEQEGNISIAAYVKNDDLFVEIADDGVGIPADRLHQIRKMLEKHGNIPHSDVGNGIALSNIAERIRLYYGEEYGVEIYSEENKGTKVVLRFPIDF